MNDLYQGKDPRNIGTYSAAEAVHYLRVPYSTVRSWVFGARYKTKLGSKRFQPVITIPEVDKRLLSFTNLVELHVLNAIRRYHQVPLEKVRQGVAYLQKSYGMEHPLAYKKLYTDGIDLFIEHLGNLVNASRNGQLAIPEIVQIYLKRIEWDETDLPTKLYPFTRTKESELPRLIVINPTVSFGQPVLEGTGVPTSILALRYAAGESIEDLAVDYDCDRLKIEEAIRYELPLAA
ncbi:DUF433 domain-containing protein [Scytonema sp. UIC 10036]|uniref:DUF433 domain-containing protein n=1 Tax=Scytonema sp. UIC 10036 TaxID=2304196 RepID=UPI0012DAA953|nr:DUF433 domain-containing protein [Scytonema sp. UIC 10036]MUG94178.1 DUF433 domain-containing protein [Scytonema sp. UIC 10036]